MHKINNRYLMLSLFALLFLPTLAQSNILKSLPKDLFSETPYKADTDPDINLTSIVSDEFKGESNDINFKADTIETNSKENTIIAKGNVNITRKNVVLYSDEITYYQKEDKIIAKGNVVLKEDTGNVIFAEEVNLIDKMDKISMDDIKVVLKDKSHMAAKSFKKFKNDNKLMKNAVYSPCDLCQTEDPLWQIKARKVRHNAETKDINYNDAFVEVKGVPVLYTPFFSHPDPTVKRRSGFLPPSLSSSNYFGARITGRYFWDISDNQSMLISPGMSSEVGPIMEIDYNRYFYKGELKLSGGYLRDNNNDYSNSNRGNLYAKGRYEINDLWISDFDIKYVSDRTYLKEMNLSNKDDAWLNSSVRFRRFHDRDYTALEAYSYKRISYDLRPEDKPYIVPLMVYENVGDVNKYGFYTRNDLSLASIYRKTDDSSYRATMVNYLVMPSTTSYGAKNKLMASLKSDFYYIDNYENSNQDVFTGSVARVFPQISYEWRLPFVKATESFRQIIEPIIVAVASPNGGDKPNKIPNNDSRNSRLDDTNVLDVNRYAGYDVNDEGSRVSYGLNWSSYGDLTGRSSLLLAQSYKFRRGDRFSEENTDKGYFSDYIGRVYANPHKYVDVNYRFILDKKDYELKYSELSTKLGSKVLNTDIGYIFLRDINADSISNSNLNERKELYVSINMALTRYWSLSLYNRQDLTDHGGSLEHGGRLVYEDECLILATNVRKDNSNDPKYDKNFEVTVDFFLKTIGGVGTN